MLEPLIRAYGKGALQANAAGTESSVSVSASYVEILSHPLALQVTQQGQQEAQQGQQEAKSPPLLPKDLKEQTTLPEGLINR